MKLRDCEHCSLLLASSDIHECKIVQLPIEEINVCPEIVELLDCETEDEICTVLVKHKPNWMTDWIDKIIKL